MTEESETSGASADEHDAPQSLPNAAKKFKMLTFAFAITTLMCAAGWYGAATPLATNTDSYRNFEISWGMDGKVCTQRWKTNGNRSQVWLDLNDDFNYEKISAYSFEDNLTAEMFDEDEDGYAERSVTYTPSGKVMDEFYDLDEDGCYERIVTYQGNLKVEYKDMNSDCDLDSLYVYSGNLLINSLSRKEWDNFLSLPVTDSIVTQK